MTTDIKAEVFAAKVYGDISVVLEQRLKVGQPITREYVRTTVDVKLSHTEYAADARMAEYLTASLSSSYIG